MSRAGAAALLVLGLLAPRPVPAQTAGRAGEDQLVRSVRDADVVRGVWVTRWEYRSPQDVAAVMSAAADWGMTDVFFQVRGRADAFYRSRLEPWGSELSGRLGQDPGWDPLQTAIGEAHARGLRLHAWINTFPIWSGDSPPPPSEPEHVYRAHPEWIMADRSGLTQRLGNRFGYVSAAPGNPQVQEHVRAVVLDIVSRYGVDGLHFDYIRLPDADYSYDAVSRGRYLRETTHETYMEWQTGEITKMVRRICQDARTVRPDLVMTAAVVNRYERGTTIFAQDPAEWVGPEALDYVIAMAYTPIPAEFIDMLGGYREAIPVRHLAAGVNLDDMPSDPYAVAAEVHESLLSGLKGHVFFSMDGLRRLGRAAYGQADVYGYLEAVRGMRITAARSAPASETAAHDTGGESPHAMRAPLKEVLAAVAGALLIALIIVP